MRPTTIEGLTDQQVAELRLTQVPIEQARSLPRWVYTDPAYHDLEESRVLRREWLSIGRAADIPNTGDYFTTTILQEPLLVVRDDTGEVRTLSNVCRHRAMVLASGSGNTNKFACPYHAWTYDLKGQLRGVPMMDGNTAFDWKSCRLPQIKTEIWEGFIFINFDDQASPLAERLAPLSQIIAPFRVAQLQRAGKPLVYDQHFNWKLLTDNWENYHVLGAHKNTFPLNQGYTADSLFPWAANDHYSLWVNPMQPGHEFPAKLAGGRAKITDLPPEAPSGILGVHVYPCHLMLLMPEDVLYYKVLPQSVDYFKLEAHTFMLPEIAGDPQLEAAFEERMQGLDFVHGVEDVAVLEGGNRGWRSQLMEQGYLSPEEKALWEFYQYLVPRLLGETNQQPSQQEVGGMS